MKPSIFRRAKWEDAPTLHALETACFGEEAWALATIRALFSHEKNWVWLGEGEFLIASKIGDEAEIERIGVLPERRGKGWGQKLLGFALDELRARGVERVFLEVRAGNGNARRLYERCGFVENGKRRGYYDDGEDAITMSLPSDFFKI